VLGRYIADFFAPSLRLVVEVDGGSHQHRHTADTRRDRWMRRQGYTVVRVSARDVVGDVGSVVNAIAETARALGRVG
jgi:very-short-patch-repair endonuclease